MRISDLSSDVFSSDLPYPDLRRAHALRLLDGADAALRPRPQSVGRVPPGAVRADGPEFRHGREDRKRVVKGKSVSVSVDLGGRGIIKKQHNTSSHVRSKIDHILLTKHRQHKKT